MHGFIPSCSNKISIWKNPSDKVHKAWKRAKFFWVFNGFKQFSIELGSRGGLQKGHHHRAHHLVRAPDSTLPSAGETTGHPSPITSSIANHNAPLLWPALTPFFTWLCRHLSTNLFSLFLASYLSSVSAVCMFLTTHFLMQGTDFSHVPFLRHLPRCIDVHVRAASPCPCLMLPPTHWSFSHAFQQWMTGLSLHGVWIGQISSFCLSCWRKMEIWIPCRV